MQSTIIVGKIIRMHKGEKVSYITIACREGKESVEFIPVTVFQTEFINKHFHEGKWIGVKGKIHINKHNNSYDMEIISEDLFFVGEKPQEEINSFEELTQAKEEDFPWTT